MQTFYEGKHFAEIIGVLGRCEISVGVGEFVEAD